eukprot:gene13446-biopygen1860
MRTGMRTFGSHRQLAGTTSWSSDPRWPERTGPGTLFVQPIRNRFVATGDHRAVRRSPTTGWNHVLVVGSELARTYWIGGTIRGHELATNPFARANWLRIGYELIREHESATNKFGSWTGM